MTLQETYDDLLSHALSFPEAWEDSPWGERAIKVRKKVFVFSGFSTEAGRFSLSVKLPVSAADVLERSEAKPTGYGLGRHGWVSMSYAAPDAVPVEALKEWIEESYCAVAPKTLARKLLARG